MGQSLDAHVGYGFLMDRHIELDELPEIFKVRFTPEQVAEMTYSEVDDLSGNDYIEAFIKAEFSTLDLGYPGNEYCEEMIVFIERTEHSAYYAAEPLNLQEHTDEERNQMAVFASLLDKEAQWMFWPTHG